MAWPLQRESSRPTAASALALIVVTAVLYLAREVLIPLALATLFSFLLAPAVRRLEQWHLPRVAAPLPGSSTLPSTPLDLIGMLGVPLLTLLAATIAVVVLTVMMLLQRDDLRDRLIRLTGAGRINSTTQAMEDAAGRVTRYLVMQL